jgi:hypothetical protein
VDGFAVLQMKKFEGLTDALKYYTALKENAKEAVGENNLQYASFYIIAPSNFKLLKRTEDFGIYEPYFMTNYINK